MQRDASGYRGFLFTSSAMLALAKLDPSVSGGVALRGEGRMQVTP